MYDPKGSSPCSVCRRVSCQTVLSQHCLTRCIRTPHTVRNVKPCSYCSRANINKCNVSVFKETCSTFQYTEMPPTIKSSILYSHWLSKNMGTEICRTVTLPVVLYRCTTWSVTLLEEHGLRVFENTALREYLGLWGRKWQEDGEDCIQSNSPN